MKECSTPPSEPVCWTVLWPRSKPSNLRLVWGVAMAWDAHQTLPGAPSFGECAVERDNRPGVLQRQPKKPNQQNLTEAQKRKRAREAIIQPKTAENRRR